MVNNLGSNEKQVRVISWIHSHVKGMDCSFSSIDIHTQCSLQDYYPGSFGTVVEIKKDSSIGKFDAFVVTELGGATVWDCNERNRAKSLARVQHQKCSSSAFYKSI